MEIKIIIEDFLSKNIFGHQINCGKYICHGDTKIITEIFVSFIFIFTIFLFYYTGLLLIQNSLRSKNYIYKNILFILFSLWLKIFLYYYK